MVLVALTLTNALAGCGLQLTILCIFLCGQEIVIRTIACIAKSRHPSVTDQPSFVRIGPPSECSWPYVSLTRQDSIVKMFFLVSGQLLSYQLHNSGCLGWLDMGFY